MAKVSLRGFQIVFLACWIYVILEVVPRIAGDNNYLHIAAAVGGMQLVAIIAWAFEYLWSKMGFWKN